MVKFPDFLYERIWVVRVISGRLKGRTLVAPKGLSLRPTSDRVRESIFNLLQRRFPAGHVLDLFAGTGALGIEALSRGGETAVFVEKSPESIAALRKNIAHCGLEKETEILIKDVQRAIEILQDREISFDLIFLDPPYGKGLAGRTLESLSRSSILASAGLIVAEHSPAETLEEFPFLERVDRRKYGGTLVSLFQPAPGNY